MNAPGYLAIGHISKDLRPDGTGVAGGTVLYATVTAQRLGTPAALVTALAADDGDLLDAAVLAGVTCMVNPSPTTTTFGNHYRGTTRRQLIYAQGAPIQPTDVPPEWHSAPIVHLAPVAQELACDPAWLALFPNALIGVTPQGWMRTWGADGVVRPLPWAGAAAFLPGCHVLVLSDEDAGGDERLLEEYARLAPLAVVTAGARPARLYEHGRLVAHIAARPATPTDLTGAGDVFTAAFLLAYYETGDAPRAARFAHATAAAAIEDEGTKGIPDRKTVEARLSAAAANPPPSAPNPHV